MSLVQSLALDRELRDARRDPLRKEVRLRLSVHWLKNESPAPPKHEPTPSSDKQVAPLSSAYVKWYLEEAIPLARHHAFPSNHGLVRYPSGDDRAPVSEVVVYASQLPTVQIFEMNDERRDMIAAARRRWLNHIRGLATDACNKVWEKKVVDAPEDIAQWPQMALEWALNDTSKGLVGYFTEEARSRGYMRIHGGNVLPFPKFECIEVVDELGVPQEVQDVEVNPDERLAKAISDGVSAGVAQALAALGVDSLPKTSGKSGRQS